jgi:CubicO group peptidase (beta-lactamase class C family)
VRTRFRISSLSTDIIFIALLQLVDRGRVDLDDSLCEHIEPCPRRWQPITVRLLVQLRSGLPSARPLPRRSRSIPEWIAALGARPLAFRPGKGRDRSEAAMLVGAHLLQRVSRTRWPRYLERSVFRRAGMHATAVDRTGLPGRATPYFRRLGGRLASRPRSLASASQTSSTASPRPSTTCTASSAPDDRVRSSHAGSSRRTSTPEAARALGPGPTTSRTSGTGRAARPAAGTRPSLATASRRLTIVAFSNMGGFSLSDVVHRIGLIAAGVAARHESLLSGPCSPVRPASTSGGQLEEAQGHDLPPREARRHARARL